MNRVSGGLDEVAILSVDPFAAFMTVKGRGVEYIGHPGSAPGALSLGLSEADHGTQNGGQDSSDDHGNAEDGAEACKAKHGAHDEAHGGDDYTEEEATEGAAHGRFFFIGYWLLIGLRRNFRTAQGAEAPRR